MAGIAWLISLSQRYIVIAMMLCGYLQQPVTGLYAPSNGTLLTVGGQATLTCAKNRSSEAVFWWRDGRQIQNDTTKYLIHNHDVDTTLTIYDTGEGDVGVYQCKSYHDTHDVNLFSRPVVHEPESHSVSLTEGDDVELVCTGWGWPVPYVIWTREDYFDHVYGVNDVGVTLRDVNDDMTCMTSASLCVTSMT